MTIVEKTVPLSCMPSCSWTTLIITCLPATGAPYTASNCARMFAVLEKARKVIDCTRGLQPWAYVAHLDGRAVLSPATTPAALRRWQAEAVQALELVSAWAGGPRQVALERGDGVRHHAPGGSSAEMYLTMLRSPGAIADAGRPRAMDSPTR